MVYSRSTLSGHWQGFVDPETDINQFEWCLGYDKYNCSITFFENVQLADSFITSGLNLHLSVPLYLTIRATNNVGLYSLTTSDAFIVDKTVPKIKQLPQFITSSSDSAKPVSKQTDNSLLHMSWRFEDQDSPIVKHILTLKAHHETNVSLEIKEIGPETSHILTFSKDNRLRNGDAYSVSVTACNQADLCATAHSNEVLIDSTPPQLGGFMIPMLWENEQIGNATKARVNISWSGFSDIESLISEYHLMVSRSYDGFELSEGIKRIVQKSKPEEKSVSLLLSDQLFNGEHIILSIRAENGVGLITEFSKLTVTVVTSNKARNTGHLQLQRHSCDVHYCTNDCTCAIIGRTCEAPKIIKRCVNVPKETNVKKYPEVKIRFSAGKDDNEYYTASTSCLSANWRLTKADYLQNITRFEWSMGLKGHGVGVGIFDQQTQRIWYSIGRQQNITYCLPHDKSLQNGQKYVVYVRVWYSFTEYKQFESQPIVIDYTAPHIRRGKMVMDSNEVCVTDFDVTTRRNPITACWGGVFQDSQSGIDSYVIQLGSTPYGMMFYLHL